MSKSKRQPEEAAATSEDVAPANPTTPRENGDEAEQQRKYAPDPFAIAGDYEAGVKLLESRRFRRAEITFADGKPSQAVLDQLKADGFRWNPDDKVWTRPIGREDAMATRIEAERTYKAVVDQMRQDKGLPVAEKAPF